MTNVPEVFGSNVFNENVMKERLPKAVYKALKKTIESGNPLDPSLAESVATAMKDWAIQKGVTHYTHWFQPLTGVTAEKHDSFIEPTEGGNVIMEFSGKNLIQGEPDASSFPSGGLRSTFEARGYTAWDPTSYAFIKNNTLCIPTAFCSYGGEILDKKIPLLRSMEAINKQALRILRLFGNTEAQHVTTTVGPEQEYFLVDGEMFKQRKDLRFTGRTLFGAMPPKGQELEDHYFGAIRTRVMEYMQDLDEELWKLGILAKTRHNEVAPAQHELATIYTSTNIATDNNQLVMEMMKKVASRHGLACLLHEKPFDGVNGSGKHNNWSLATDLGENLLEPGKTPRENMQFLTFLTAVIKAVDDYQDLLRISVASAGNDHRLGANEAPPAIVSMFLGDELQAVIDSLKNDQNCKKFADDVLNSGVSVLPDLPKDSTDRNRTSPFAFTGNKFEFRMLGSGFSLSCTNIILNSIVADTLGLFADKLEKVEANEFNAALNTLLKDELKAHERIVFNGNNYSDEWVAEAEKRGLLNLKSTADALPHYTDKKNVEMFERQGVYNLKEMEARQESLLEEYYKVLHIEVLTMLDMARTEIAPAVLTYSKELAKTLKLKKDLGVSAKAEEKLLNKLSALNDKLSDCIDDLSEAVDKTSVVGDTEAIAHYYHDVVLPKMDALRQTADGLEVLTAGKYWPFPTYGELLFY
ncbi:MAG TPA: glutamine synthetase III [Candidatus Avidehalobacter gallistercoris]|uniref:Glutamine synthetase III n=1 Tax=Candidatus Avidehalobacter gallistercoris TaxID=2840694 RepID=A0A9D1HKU4_9FIRM|nr:glutamine synthetase III [Candidatus Avidehalobacter gallistercoris]